MPLGKRLAGGTQPIGTSRRQPVEPAQVLPVQFHAVGDQLHSVRIVEATTISSVKQLASDIGRIEESRFFVFELVNAASTATVAQGLPFAAVQRGERFLPKWRVGVHLMSSLALLSQTNQAGSRGHKVVKQLAFGLIFLSSLAVTPAFAQLASTPGADLVDAVKKSDGDKATQILSSRPAGIVDAKDSDGNTGLIIAINRGDEQWTGFLLNKGADPNLAGKGGNTPLISAARIGFDNAVEWLISLGARVDTANRMGETPLIIAVQQRETPIVRLLLNAGANPDKTDNAAGYSARDYASRDPRAKDILKLIQDKKPKGASAAK